MGNNNVLDIFHPVISEWFTNNIGNPSAPQVQAWPAVQRGENVLVIAPTGAGKTLSAFMECINFLFVQGVSGELEDGVQVLYVSPLKALNNDIYRNLEVPLHGIEALCLEKGLTFPGITMGLRTGDTPASERRKMAKKPPHILITTPESLYLILTSSGTRDILRTVKYLIVDEIHTLLGSKRGVHLAVSMERLADLTGRPMVRIGLSATVKPADEAAKYLGGFEEKDGQWTRRPVTIIEPLMSKSFDFGISMPVKDFRVIEEGTIWPSIYRNILNQVREHNSTLVFVNSRTVAEKVSANLNSLAGETIALAHHGCISRESRLEVEKQLKSGKLPCLVATSSMELGIDVGAIDLVIQVASPKSAARGLQRLGRAGHRLNAVSKGRLIPRTKGDLLESAIVSMEMLKGNIEEEYGPKNSLDVLAQQLVAMSCTKEWTLDEIIKLLRSAYPYQTLKTDELLKVLCMLAGEYEHRSDSPGSPKIVWDRVNRVLRGNNYSRMLAIGGSGTIPDRGYYGVYLEDGRTKLGELDETFVYEARIGERFMLGTSAWRIEEIRRDRVVVSQSGGSGAKTPFWTGEGLGRPYQLGLVFGSFLDELSKMAGTKDYLQWIKSCTPLDETGAKNLENYVLEQINAVGCLAGSKRIVVEYFSDEVGDSRIIIHSPYGGRVNGGLKIIFQHVLQDALRCQVEVSHNDDGVLINILGYHEHIQSIFSLISSVNAKEILVEELPMTPLFSLTFRYNAARALMMGQKRYGKRTQLWAQRIRAIEVMQIAEKYTDHPLIVETFRECMETVLDIPNLIKVLDGVKSGEIQVVESTATHPSPFASELLFNFMGVMMYEGQIPDPKKLGNKVISRIGSLNLSFEDSASERLVDSHSLLEAAGRSNPYKLRKSIKTADDFHDFLLTYGDIELSDRSLEQLKKICTSDPADWMESLKSQGRTVIIETGEGNQKLFIAYEEYPMYAAALDINNGPELHNDDEWTKEEALSRIVRRFARYNSPFTSREIYGRYSLVLENADKILSRLEEDNYIVRDGFENTGKEWCHSIVFERAKRLSLYNARNSVAAKESCAYAAFLPIWQGIGKTSVAPVEDLYGVIKSLQGFFLNAEWWEDFIFPSRITGYKKSYLDKLCSTGRVVWRTRTDGTILKLAWFPSDSINEEGEGDISPLNEEERLIFDVLKRKGASFFQSISAASSEIEGEVIDVLEGMVWKGVISNDSFEPIRYFLSSKPSGVKMRARMRAAAYKVDMGRWGIVSGNCEIGAEDQLMLWLNRYGLVAKEILQCEKSKFPWGDIYEILKQWEYTGKVNRGYYIKGLSGMQFMLPGASERLNISSSDYFVMNACDPAQSYGRILAFPDGEVSWNCTPGTAVVQKEGKPLLIVEGYGERFIPVSCSKEETLKAVNAFVDAFNKSFIWPKQKKINIKQWLNVPASKCEFSEELGFYGFNKEMQDLVLWR